ncbi:LIM and calponin homology domains-containing protein 1 isoform X2 [Ambystoma mexicanum]|uniref:LIM and calponin homology domains-containing protein 1 isoform X2 n=1 Tax=Ambystoma mexicanum TaxID=8296 RepID=UPI0037E91329
MAQEGPVQETEDIDSPKRSIRDSGYIDCWDSERSDSLSPPRHGRDDSFDSLDSFGSRSQQTPSPDVVLRGSSDGRGSDSESDYPHRRIPDVKKDDMSARRISFGENKAFVPFNQYLPNKSNHTAYIPAPLRKKKAEREEYRKSWSTATSPLGGEKPFSEIRSELKKGGNEEVVSECLVDGPTKKSSLVGPGGILTQSLAGLDPNQDVVRDQATSRVRKEIPEDKRASDDAEELRKLKKMERVGIRVMPAAKRYSSHPQTTESHSALPATPDIILRKENTFMAGSKGKGSDSEEEEDEYRVPDITKDDLATRRIRLNQTKTSTRVNQLSLGLYASQKRSKQDDVPAPPQAQAGPGPVLVSEHKGRPEEGIQIVTRKENPFLGLCEDESEEEEELEKTPDIQRDDLAKRKTQGSALQAREPASFMKASITKADIETWERLRVSAETSDDESRLPAHVCKAEPSASEKVPVAPEDDLACRKTKESRKRPHHRQRFVHFGPVTEIDQQKWEKLSLAKPEATDEVSGDVTRSKACSATAVRPPVGASEMVNRESNDEGLQYDASEVTWPAKEGCRRHVASSLLPEKQKLSGHGEGSKDLARLADPSRDDMSMRRLGVCRKKPGPDGTVESTASVVHHHVQKRSFPEVCSWAHLKEESSSVSVPGAAASCHVTPSPSSVSGVALEEESQQVINTQCQKIQDPEAGVRAPDPEKDDMMTRRTGVSHRMSSPGLKHFLPVPFAKKKEDPALGPMKSDKLVTSTSKPLPCILQDHAQARAESVQKPATVPQLKERGEPQPQEGEVGQHQETEGDTRLALQPLTSVQEYPTLNETLPGPSASSVPETPPQHEVLRFSPRTVVSDDAESMSMCDVRCEEAAVTQPHSRLHQEQLQNVNNLLKEEDDQWQDDLARWKTRRRSASQDLIKKEQERKKMEKVLSGEDALSERRKSIKTYKEIVEEKERREKELHEAYKNATSRDEAERILQKYIERFTISEAVLERIQMPKIVERSHSVQPNSLSPPGDPNPMKYLRQQSLPVASPKFTATVEATIAPTSESGARFSTGRTSPSKATASKAVPLLVPKPYSQPKCTQVLKTFKVDANVSLNGDAFNGIEDEHENKYASPVFAPSVSRSQMFEGVARIQETNDHPKHESATVELNLRRPVSCSVGKDVMASPTEEPLPANQNEENHSGGCAGKASPGRASPEVQKQTVTKSSFPATASLEHTAPDLCEVPAIQQKDTSCVERDAPRDIVLKQKAVKSETNELEEYAVFEFFKKAPKAPQSPGQNAVNQEPSTGASVPAPVRNTWRRSQFFSQAVDSGSCDESSVLVPAVNSSKRANLWSWDPEEERKRQERWQQEQERLLQERYQREQEKLKDEWEKAQKEVEEEERKYYEEERKIIEDTVVPFTVSSSSTEPFSSCSSSSTTEETRASGSLSRLVPELNNNHRAEESETCSAVTGNGVAEKQLQAESKQHSLQWGQEEESLPLSNGRADLCHEEPSRKEVIARCPEIVAQGRAHTVTEERSSPARMELHLQDPSRSPQLPLKKACVSEDLSLKAATFNQSSSLQVHTTGGMRRTGSSENIKAGHSSPCSPTPHCPSPSRSVSGKKLCSTCGVPLGKGAAMIIETLGLFFHIQCFQCGICKGQLGDTTSGTDVRIRNGLLNCNDCYIRSRTAGQPTTL